jgi:hypothetical protein
MCITTGPAELGQTMAFTYATLLADDPRTEHITGYQTSASNLLNTPNMMILHFPGDDIELVGGPQNTWSLMQDLTGMLPSLEATLSMRGISGGTRVQSYGDYYVVLAEEARDILSATDLLPEDFRPEATPEFMEVLDFFESTFSGYCFVLACWRDRVVPRHPIVVKYVPHNDDVLFVPGIEAHDGLYPNLDSEEPRNFRVAFAADGYVQPFHVYYHDTLDPNKVIWAPRDVTGFFDNRVRGNNGDYVIPLESIVQGLSGWDLFENRIL